MSEKKSKDLRVIPAESTDVVMNPPALLALAVQQGADLTKLEKLMELQERWEKNEARKAWVVAMAAFKADPPEIFKDKKVKFDSRGGQTSYNHATIGHVVDAITAGFSKYGFSHRWEVDQPEGRIRVTCIITHAQGHSESTELQAGADNSGGKNSIQAIGSTVTYLQRYSLLAAVGLAAKDMDDDGRGAEPPRNHARANPAPASAKPTPKGPARAEPARLRLSEEKAKKFWQQINELGYIEDGKALLQEIKSACMEAGDPKAFVDLKAALVEKMELIQIACENNQRPIVDDGEGNPY